MTDTIKRLRQRYDNAVAWDLPALLDIAEFVQALANIVDEGVTVPALRQMAKEAMDRLDQAGDAK